MKVNKTFTETTDCQVDVCYHYKSPVETYPTSEYEIGEVIKHIVANFYNIYPSQMDVNTNYRFVSHCRNVMYYFLSKYTGYDMKSIGSIFGSSRNRATVYSGLRSLREQIDVDKNLQRKIKQIDSRIRNKIFKNSFII